MARLRVLSGTAVCRILAAHGFVEVRMRGSHVVMQRRSGESTITVPVPDHAELRVGTLSSIIRQSGLPRSLFEESR
ncbi:MAG: type II toxin-antitoxin system HicA family toxin [Chloroflexi bacterium]|nr:type II toxin-antitoxin system HicA family toxin [Chloroflexota bacterium]